MREERHGGEIGWCPEQRYIRPGPIALLPFQGSSPNPLAADICAQLPTGFWPEEVRWGLVGPQLTLGLEQAQEATITPLAFSCLPSQEHQALGAL